MSLQHAMNGSFLMWSRAVEMRGFAFVYGTSFGPFENSTCDKCSLLTEVTAPLLGSQVKILLVAILYKCKIPFKGSSLGCGGSRVVLLCVVLGQTARMNISECHQVPLLQLDYHSGNNSLEH